MSGGGAGGGGKGAAAAGPVPQASRKLVQSLKEIVNRPDAEIYAALRECAMDPDEAVSRLLSQDTFQEVKSKRDKKKEVKETPEPRSRAASNATSRGIRGGPDRGGRSNSAYNSSIDNMTSRSSVSGSGETEKYQVHEERGRVRGDQEAGRAARGAHHRLRRGRQASPHRPPQDHRHQHLCVGKEYSTVARDTATVTVRESRLSWKALLRCLQCLH